MPPETRPGAEPSSGRASESRGGGVGGADGEPGPSPRRPVATPRRCGDAPRTKFANWQRAQRGCRGSLRRGAGERAPGGDPSPPAASPSRGFSLEGLGRDRAPGKVLVGCSVAWGARDGRNSVYPLAVCHLCPVRGHSVLAPSATPRRMTAPACASAPQSLPAASLRNLAKFAPSC